MYQQWTAALTALLLTAPAAALDRIQPWSTAYEAGGTRTQLYPLNRTLVLTATEALTTDFFDILLVADVQGTQQRLGAAVVNCGNGSLSEVALYDTPLDAERQQREYRELRNRVALELLHQHPRLPTLETRVREHQLAAPRNARETALLQAACGHLTETGKLPDGGEFRHMGQRHNEVRRLPGGPTLILQADEQSLPESGENMSRQRFLLPLSQQDGIVRFEVQEVLLAPEGTLAAGSQRLHWQEMNCRNGETRELRDLRPVRALGEGGNPRYLNLAFRDPALSARQSTLGEALTRQPWTRFVTHDEAYLKQLQTLCHNALRPRTSNLYARPHLGSWVDSNLARLKPEEWTPADIITSYFQDPLPLHYTCQVVPRKAGVSDQLFRDFQNALTAFSQCDQAFLAEAQALHAAPERLLREHHRRRFLPAHREAALLALRARMVNVMELREAVISRQKAIDADYQREYEQWRASQRR